MLIFISHSEKDTAPYSSLCVALESENLDYWDSKRMKSGLSLKGQLREAINQCDICIFIATRSSVESKWCLAETGAFWGAGKRIILYVANPDIGENKLPPLFQGDLRTCDVREVIRQTKEAIAEADKARQVINEAQPYVQTQVSEEENNIEERFKSLTPAEKNVLRSYIKNGTRTQTLQYDSGVVVGLIHDHILYYASNRATGFWDPRYLYTDVNIQRWAWTYLNEHPDVLGEEAEDAPKQVEQ